MEGKREGGRLGRDTFITSQDGVMKSSVNRYNVKFSGKTFDREAWSDMIEYRGEVCLCEVFTTNNVLVWWVSNLGLRSMVKVRVRVIVWVRVRQLYPMCSFYAFYIFQT